MSVLFASLFQEDDLQNATIMALALNRVDFLELLLNYCVSVNSILTKSLLQFLYGYQSRISQSPIKEMIEDKHYCSVDENCKHYNTIKTLCGYTGQETSKCCIQLSKIGGLVEKLCGNMIKKGHERFIEVILKTLCVVSSTCVGRVYTFSP